MSVNTAKVVGRRTLKFASYDELLADVKRLTSRPVKALGNWSSGQIFRHLAIVYNASIDGFSIKFPLPLRLVGKVFRKRLLGMSMPAGFKLSGPAQKTMVPPATSAEEGASELRAAIARLKQEPTRAPHPLFGTLTRDEWDRVHLSHAALHLSFLLPQ